MENDDHEALRDELAELALLERVEAAEWADLESEAERDEAESEAEWIETDATLEADEANEDADELYEAPADEADLLAALAELERALLSTDLAAWEEREEATDDKLEE